MRIQPAYTLYPYQSQVVTQALDQLTRPHKGPGINAPRVVVHLPTGAGKTRVACVIATMIFNRYENQKRLLVWLASSEELCQQAAESLDKAWKALGNREIPPIYRHWADFEVNLRKLEPGILVASLQKLRADASSKIGILSAMAERTGIALVVFDEAHQAIAPSYQLVTESLVDYGAPLLGLTATPGRKTEISEEDRELAMMFRDNKITITPPGNEENVISYLVREGYLADVQFNKLEVETGEILPRPGKGQDYSPEDLDVLGHNPRWHDQLLETSKNAMTRYYRVMIFAPSVDSAQNLAMDLNVAGFHAEAVVAETPSDERRRIIENYKSSDDTNKALVNFGVFTAGFDAPKTQCVVIGRPTNSVILYSQMVGRAMRGPCSGGNRKSMIYTVTDPSIPGFGSVIEAFTHWEEIWKK